MEIKIKDVTITIEIHDGLGTILGYEADAEFYVNDAGFPVGMRVLIGGDQARQITDIVIAAAREQFEEMMG